MKPQKYNFSEIENKINKFRSKFKSKKKIENKNLFTILLPPPNVTGNLHLGHYLDIILPDVIAKYHSQRDFQVLFFPGVDHAGIATQAICEKHLWLTQKKTKFDLGRAAFKKEILILKNKNEKLIKNEWNSYGVSLNYNFFYYTLSNKFSSLVKKTFLNLHQNKYIFYDQKIVYFDYQLKTVLSNIEVNFKEIKTKLYYVKYFLENSSEYLTVATTRPETIFSDVALAVNKNSKIWKKYQNKLFVNPLTKNLIPLVTSSKVESDFGTGILKLTPSHDFLDFEINKEYQLKNFLCIDENGNLNQFANEYQGIFYLKGREIIVNDLKKQNLLEKVEDYDTIIGYSSRSNTIVDARISNQWFLDLNKIYQENKNFFNLSSVIVNNLFEKKINYWLNNLEPWCISRQLWWGHKIPKIVKSNDVLDTWFSSALCFTYFYELLKIEKIDLLVTGYDILFFWVIRMIFMSYLTTKKMPFKNIYLHGLLRDATGKKMSKSNNNGIIPSDILKKYGNDSLRFFLLGLVNEAKDINFYQGHLEDSKKFVNKIFNANIFLSQKWQTKEDAKNKDLAKLMLNFLELKVYLFSEDLSLKIKNFNFIGAKILIYQFSWDFFCNQFLEIYKIFNFYHEEFKLLWMKILWLIFPYLPFISQYIFLQYQNKNLEQKKYFFKKPKLLDQKVPQNLIDLFLTLKNQKNETVFYDIKTSNSFIFNIFNYLSQKNNLKFEKKSQKFFKNIYFFNDDITIEILDNKKKKDDLKTIEEYKTLIEKTKKLLSNQNFLTKAKKEVVLKEKEKLKKLENELEIFKN
ncbi:class I tRNA ligase family protein [symbiont of Argiope bruennichi]|uniref:class I tRNA ligase family protein n=1 Tax=symbiont of Argiope bruennichi TaxID=2810479 RepID=UPI003DA2A7F6